MSERVPCLNPECKNTILPATAAINQGLCAPCIGEIRRKEHQEYLRLNRKTVDLYAGVIDPVEMVLLMMAPRKYDPLVVYAPPPLSLEDVVASMSSLEISRLKVAARESFENGNTNLAEDLARALATLTDADLTELQSVWIGKECCYPPVIFRSGTPEIRDSIIKALMSGRMNANDGLSALAWIGDEVVTKAFLEWDERMPKWASKLHVSPSRYAEEAGWEIENNERRDLFHHDCYGLFPAENADEVESVKIFRGADQDCPWCGSEMSYMLDIDLRQTKFAFLSPSSGGMRVLTCHGCTCYGAFYASVPNDGPPLPHPKSERPSGLTKPSYEWSDSVWKNVPFTVRRRRAFHSVESAIQLKSSQIGGLPTWVQNASYPSCPDCSKTMGFLAQLDQNDFPGNEGSYYAFFCPGCRTTATTYQQT